MPSALTAAPRKSPSGSAPYACAHCQSPCPDDRLRLDDKLFCCEGCKMVYEILSVNNLCDFYRLDPSAGLQVKKYPAANSYAYLDDPEVQEKLLEFSHGQSAQATFYLPQVHCISCVWLLEHLYKLDEGLSSSRVNFLKKTVTVQFHPARTSLRKIAALLASVGYAPEINLGDVEGTRAPGISKKLAYQIGIAGFAVGNIMLFSFPEYVGLERGTDAWFSNVFGYLSLLLSLPVLLFSARDYLVSAWNGLRTRHLNIDIPLVLAILMLFGRSVWEILTHTGPGYLDSFSGLVFLLLVAKWFQQRTWNRLSFERDYRSYFPVAATVKIGDTETSVPVNRLVPGDIIVVRNQEIIPADGLLLQHPARVDYSFVTGESDPVAVQSGEKVYAGGKQMGESIEIALTRRVAQSHLTQLWNNEAFKPHGRGQVTRLADAAGRYFTAIILAFGLASLAYWWGWRGDVATAINAFTAVMIVACPCTVAMAIPFTLGNVMRILGRHRFYLKNTHVVEAFADLDTVVLDKTGTITQVAEQQLSFVGEPLSFAEKVAVRSLTRHSAHPLSRQIYASLSDITVEPVERFEEKPGLGVSGRVNGQEVKVGSGEFVGSGPGSPAYVDVGPAYAEASAGKKGINVAVDHRVRGYFAVRSTYRDGLAGVLDFFRSFLGPRKKPRVFLLSGDQDHEAARLAPFFPDAQSMLFNRSPQDKLEFIKQLQQDGQKVLMLGDGLNDAGALQQSDLGIVVTENTNNFTPACDAILHAAAFDRLPQFIRLAREGTRSINWSYAVALSYNLIGLTFAVQGLLSPLFAAVLMPVSSVSVVLFGVGRSNWMARKVLKEGL